MKTKIEKDNLLKIIKNRREISDLKSKIELIEDAMDCILKIKITNNEDLINIESCFYKLNELRKLEENNIKEK